MSRLLNVNNFPVFDREQYDAMSMDTSSAQFHLFLRQMQRDEGVISDREMAIAERVAGPIKNAGRPVLFNPFTGELNKPLLREMLKNG